MHKTTTMKKALYIIAFSLVVLFLVIIAMVMADAQTIKNWMRNRNTVEFLGLWETLNNPELKGVEFDTFQKEAGLNSFTLTPKKWVDATNAKGIVSKNK